MQYIYQNRVVLTMSINLPTPVLITQCKKAFLYRQMTDIVYFANCECCDRPLSKIVESCHAACEIIYFCHHLLHSIFKCEVP